MVKKYNDIGHYFSENGFFKGAPNSFRCKENLIKLKISKLQSLMNRVNQNISAFIQNQSG